MKDISIIIIKISEIAGELSNIIPELEDAVNKVAAQAKVIDLKVEDLQQPQPTKRKKEK